MRFISIDNSLISFDSLLDCVTDSSPGVLSVYQYSAVSLLKEWLRVRQNRCFLSWPSGPRITA